MRTNQEAGTSGQVAANADQVTYWNGEAARHWLEHEQRYDEMLHPFTTRLVEAVRPAANPDPPVLTNR